MSLQAQFLVGHWKVNTLFTYKVEDTYHLFKKELDTNKRMVNFGNQVIYYEDKTLVSKYTAFCGNDCFTSVTGEYEMIGKQIVRITIHTLERNGTCMGSIDETKVLGTFDIVIIDESRIDLIKRKE